MDTHKVVGVTISKDLDLGSVKFAISSRRQIPKFTLILCISGVEAKDMLAFYKSVIPPSLEYAAPVKFEKIRCLSCIIIIIWLVGLHLPYY